MKPNKTIRTVCKDCGGTGLYVGIGERDGAAVICWKCKGTGCAEIKYTPFERQRERRGVARVFERGVGIVIGGSQLADFGGMPYKEWLAGLPFPDGSEDRAHVCPARWDQGEAERRGVGCSAHPGQHFSECPHIDRKAECWDKWDRGQGGSRA